MKKFSAELKQLPKMLRFVRRTIHAAKLPKKESNQIEIALEEALVNIIHYAYDKTGNVEIGCQKNQGEVRFIIRDEGKPFNPLENVSEINRFVPLDQREVGGLGISLMDQLMDQVYYQRMGRANILTLHYSMQTI